MTHHPGSLNVLHHSLDGYVASCDSCQQIQVAFGTAVMNLDEEVLNALKDRLNEDRMAYKGQVDPRAKMFPYDVLSGHVHILLNYTEVVRLHTMLSEALWLLKVYDQLAVREQ